MSAFASFDPVLLDLSQGNDQVVLDALREYAEARERDILAERSRFWAGIINVPSSRELDLRSESNRAHQLLLDIERQLGANRDARRAVGDA